MRHDLRRQGIGSTVLDDLIERARRNGCHSMVAGVNSEQEGSYALHLKFGFREVGAVKEASYKLDRWLDQRIMQLMLLP